MMQKHFFRWPPRTATWWSDSTSWLRYRRWLHRSSFLPLWQHRQNLQTRWYLQGTVRCQKVMQLSMKKVLNHLYIGCHVHEDCNGNEYCECDEGTGCPGGSVGSCRLGCRDQVSSAFLHFFCKKRLLQGSSCTLADGSPGDCNSEHVCSPPGIPKIRKITVRPFSRSVGFILQCECTGNYTWLCWLWPKQRGRHHDHHREQQPWSRSDVHNTGAGQPGNNRLCNRELWGVHRRQFGTKRRGLQTGKWHYTNVKEYYFQSTISSPVRRLRS